MQQVSAKIWHLSTKSHISVEHTLKIISVRKISEFTFIILFFLTAAVVLLEIGCTLGRTVSGSGFDLALEQLRRHMQRRKKYVKEICLSLMKIGNIHIK
jgi:hypothetical protein